MKTPKPKRKKKTQYRIVDVSGNGGIEKNEIPFEYDLFVYSYECGSWEGDGFAVWKSGKEWSYQGLGHCSCYGPTDNIATSNNAKFKLSDIKKLIQSDDYKNDTHAQAVLQYLTLNKIK